MGRTCTFLTSSNKERVPNNDGAEQPACREIIGTSVCRHSSQTAHSIKGGIMQRYVLDVVTSHINADGVKPMTTSNKEIREGR